MLVFTFGCKDKHYWWNTMYKNYGTCCFLILHAVHFVPCDIDAGENGARDAVPHTGDGAGQHREGLGGEEVGGEVGGETGVLHAHLDADGALLRHVEVAEAAGGPPQEVAQRVVAEHHGESPDEEHESPCYQIVVDGADYAADDQGEADDTDARHQRLHGGEERTVAAFIVDGGADSHRNDGHDEDVGEHAHRVDGDDLSGGELHQERSHYRGENCGGA